MNNAVFIKLGGSFITDKRTPDTLLERNIRSAARQISAAQRRSDVPIIVGHGAGSFGHVVAHSYNAVNGIHPEFGWQGFYHTRLSMIRMNLKLLELCASEQFFPITVQPSAFMLAHDASVAHCDVSVIKKLLDLQQIPLIHGDIVVDQVRGFTIFSTETQLAALCALIPFQRIIMVSDVDGVFDANGELIHRITSRNLPSVLSCLGGSHGTDVTGGMRHKVMKLMELAQANPTTEIVILSGYASDTVITDAIMGIFSKATVVSW